MKKLCFGVFSKVLRICCSPKIAQKVFIPKIISTLDFNGDYWDESVLSRWATCERSINIYKNVQPPKQGILNQNFLKTIVPLLDEDKKVLAVLALLDIIREDEDLDSNTQEGFKKFFGATKNALLKQSEFVLHEFLAAAFLYVTVYDNNAKGADCLKSINEQYIDSFYAERDYIRLVSAPELQQEHPQISVETNMNTPNTDNASKCILSIFNDAVKMFHIVDYMDSEPSVALPKILVEYVTNFLSTIKQSIIIGLIEYQEEAAYQKVKNFTNALASYQSYLAENLYPKTDVFALTGTEDAQYIVDFKKTVDDYKQKINSIYGEINNGNTLFVL